MIMVLQPVRPVQTIVHHVVLHQAVKVVFHLQGVEVFVHVILVFMNRIQMFVVPVIISVKNVPMPHLVLLVIVLILEIIILEIVLVKLDILKSLIRKYVKNVNINVALV